MTRFAVLATIALLVLVVAGAAWLFYSSNPTAAGSCEGERQEALASAFKGDTLILGLFGAVAAAILYYLMLRLQIFFPGTDAKRILTAVAAGVALAIIFSLADSVSGSDCFRRSLSSSSAVADEIPRMWSISGRLVGNLWLAIILDQLLLALVLVASVRLGRELVFRAA